MTAPTAQGAIHRAEFDRSFNLFLIVQAYVLDDEAHTRDHGSVFNKLRQFTPIGPPGFTAYCYRVGRAAEG
jgi:hypothetical protein